MDDLSNKTPEELLQEYLGSAYGEALYQRIMPGLDPERHVISRRKIIGNEILRELRAYRAMKVKAEALIAEWDGQPITDGAAYIARQILASAEAEEEK